MQKTAWNEVVTDLDAIVAKHFDLKHNAAPDWSGITNDVGSYVHNASQNSSVVRWNSYANYNNDYVTTDEIDKTIDSKVNDLVNGHFYASAVSTALYNKYQNLINQAKDPNQKAALINEREKVAKQGWSDIMNTAAKGALVGFMAGYGMESAEKPMNPAKVTANGTSKLAEGEATLLRPLGRGSTGRNLALNLNEKLAMQEIKNNPSLGQVIQNMKPITDKRWTGWRKMQYVRDFGDGTKTVIHYNAQFDKSGKMTAVDDFKFKSP